MRALKSLVYGMGTLIVVALAVLVYAIYARVNEPGFRLFKGEAAGRSQGAFGEVRLPLADGCVLVEMRPDGKTLYLRTGPAGICERILVIDSGTGQLLGTLAVRP